MTEFDDMLAAAAARRGPCARCSGEVDGYWAEGRICNPCHETQANERAAEVRRRRLADACAHIPESHQWAAFDAPELAARVSDPSKLTKLPPVPVPLVTFLGPAGSGKTSAATALYKSWLPRIADVERTYYVTALELSEERRRSRFGDDEGRLAHAARAAPLLVLDDLGLEPAPLAEVAISLIHERHRRQRPTIVTSALEPADLGPRYGGGIARRLVEHPAIVCRFPARGAR